MTLYYQDGTCEQYMLYPGDKNRSHRKIELSHRGIYDIGIEQIKINGFFGLFYYNYRSLEYHRLLVYPKIYNLKSNKLEHKVNKIVETIYQRDNIQQNIFTDLRSYKPGDPLNKIHWKLSANRENFITKEYKGDVEHNIEIFINTEPIKNEDPLFIEDEIIEGVLSLCHNLLKNRNPLKLIWNQNNPIIYTGDKVKDFDKLYHALSNIRFHAPDNSFLKLIDSHGSKEPKHTLLVIFTGDLDPHLKSSIINKKRDGFEIVVITKSNEYKLVDMDIDVLHTSFTNNDCFMEKI